jgi:hypothetical protein
MKRLKAVDALLISKLSSEMSHKLGKSHRKFISSLEPGHPRAPLLPLPDLGHVEERNVGQHDDLIQQKVAPQKAVERGRLFDICYAPGVYYYYQKR